MSFLSSGKLKKGKFGQFLFGVKILLFQFLCAILGKMQVFLVPIYTEKGLGYMLVNTKKLFIFLILLSLIILGCGGGTSGGDPISGATSGGDAANGSSSGGNTSVSTNGGDAANGGTGAGHAEGEITLAWDSETDPAVVGYIIYYSTISRAASHQYQGSVDVGTATQNPDNITSYTLTSLKMGQTYYIAVTAYDKSHMESNFSNEVSGAAKPGK